MSLKHFYQQCILFQVPLYSKRFTQHRHRFNRFFTVLALESSADDTCAAVVTSDRQILSNVVQRQDNLHGPLGGIHPALAISAHQRNMPMVVRKSLLEAKLTMDEIDGVAFTRGPGMAGSLSVAINAAKTLACALDKPIVAVHHMQAHALTVLLTATGVDCPEFPFIAYLISGGHTLIVLAESYKRFRILATTADEAVGRAVDKVTRALLIPWSNRGLGAALEQFCMTEGNHNNSDLNLPKFPTPFPGQLLFSFSGMHSAALHYIQERDGLLNEREKLALAKTFQEAVARQLEDKLVLAMQWCFSNGVPARHVVVSGGVASNNFFRQRLRICLDTKFSEHKLHLLFPPAYLCTDNAVMVAWAAMYRFLANDSDDYAIEPKAKWDINELD